MASILVNSRFFNVKEETKYIVIHVSCTKSKKSATMTTLRAVF